ncbi:dihydrolipoyllysine-residue acetyltransferase [Thalassolituus alkanivorans]|uniref:dihydrolipoyllysine-residue acetyltransferase n=1 Tax=Thalassolituus alkanivorans TaxID=2881055 RepID=UPI000C554852|nr:dihydrolipoyllysine-residue acetyltransferase [Thalassolituus alkanivorans]MAY15708.1 dihydrolipoyllysine-residue acetyltransferase [Oceanospirillaceae bacterium]MCB2386402.1 dihydrolipoyllysine-residue acetyltransferase [Thalassolituus alkanivorans]MCB2422149.1 dihydrolipoyllysine-residue acetyltransferase [Thalassolituus alkanivorans]
MTTLKIPDLGGASQVEVIEILVSPGDTVEMEQALIVLETDKATMEIPAEAAGVIKNLSVKVGDKVSSGDVFGELDGDASGAEEKNAESAPAAEQKTTEAPVQPAVESAPSPSAEPVAAVDIAIPDLGGSEQVEVIEVQVSAGDDIDAEQTVLVLESDKASMEIPAGQAGTVISVAVKTGDKVSAGDVMLKLQPAAGNAVSAENNAAESAVAEVAPAEKTVQTTVAATAATATIPAADVRSSAAEVHAGPAVRKLAREFGVDLAQVSGSGPKQRITKDDIQRYVKQRLNGEPASVSGGSGIPAVPVVDFAKFGAVSDSPLNNIKRATARAMTTAWLNVPQVTQFDQADITDLENYRKQQNERYARQGIKFSIVPFVLKAIAKALEDFPSFNASLSADGEKLILKHYVHVGVAVDTPKGLLVPVIRDVNQKSVTQITQELTDKAELARLGKLPLADMQGGCFSLSSLGGIGGTAFTPIVNPPEVAILGLSKASMQPIWDGTAFIPRLMLPLSLSYDHRVIDGAEAARFSQRLVMYLQDLRNVLM